MGTVSNNAYTIHTQPMIMNVVISHMITNLDVVNPPWIAYGLPAECLRTAYRMPQNSNRSTGA